MKDKNSRGFLVLEVLIAGLILTASIAASMYLFRIGLSHMERVNRANLLSAKLLQAGARLKVLDLEKQSGAEDLGEGVTLQWRARLLSRDKQAGDLRPQQAGDTVRKNFSHDLFLYRVDFLLTYQGSTGEYSVHVFRSRSLYRR